MENQYEDEINLVTVLFKVCQKWRTLLIVAVAAAVAVGGTKLAMNILNVNDEGAAARREAEYKELVSGHEAQGEALKQMAEESQRKLERQAEYNQKSFLMNIDPQNEWVGSVNFYIGTDYQIVPGAYVQNGNPAYKIAYAYYDYYAGAFLADVKEQLSFDVGNYLQEVLEVIVDADRYSITVNAVADTKEHCEELARVAGEAFRSRHDFVAESLGEHTLIMSDITSKTRINAEREQYQAEQRNLEIELLQEKNQVDSEYREWERTKNSLEAQYQAPDLAGAVKSGVKWILIAGIGGGLLSGIVLFVVYIFSGRIGSGDDLGNSVLILAELPAKGKKKNAIDRLIYRIFGITVKASEYDNRLEAMALSMEKMFKAGQREKGTIAFVGDMEETGLKAFVKQVGAVLSDGYQAVAAGDIIADPAAARAAYEADAVVLVAKQGVTMKKNYARIYRKLSACKVEILGAVLLGVESQA